MESELSKKSETANAVKIKAQLLNQILTNTVFRESLRQAKENDHPQKYTIGNVLTENGYSCEYERIIVDLDFEALQKSNIIEYMPDDVEMMTMGGFNLNW